MSGINELNEKEVCMISGGGMFSRARKNYFVALLMIDAARECTFGLVELTELNPENRINFLLVDKSFLIGAFIGASLGGVGLGIVVGATIGGLMGVRFNAQRILPSYLR